MQWGECRLLRGVHEVAVQWKLGDPKGALFDLTEEAHRRVGPGSRSPGPVAQCAHRAAVHAALWEARAQHAAADLHRVEAAARLLAEEAHGRLLQLPRHRACGREGTWWARALPAPLGLPMGVQAGSFPTPPDPYKNFKKENFSRAFTRAWYTKVECGGRLTLFRIANKW